MTDFYYIKNGKQEGPVSKDALIVNISKSTKVWYEGIDEWSPAGEISELKDCFKKVPPPITPDERIMPPPLPKNSLNRPPPLPTKPSGLSSLNQLAFGEILEKFKNEFLKRDIYHSQKNFSNNISTQIAYIKKIEKQLWLAQSNTFIIVGITDSEITKQLISEFTDEAFRFAKKNNQGLLRGVNSVVGAIAVLIGKDSNDEAKKYCSKLYKKLSAIKIPVIVDINKNEITFFKGRPFYGWLFIPYYKKLISEHIKKLLVST
jgi:hypothetical protein